MVYECVTPKYVPKEFEITCQSDGNWNLLLDAMNCEGKKEYE